MENQVAKVLPKYDDLVSQSDSLYKSNEFQVLLNREPPKKWISVNKLANNTSYLPIDKVEYLLTSIFVNWRVEVINYSIIANSVCVHVRLYYTSPVNGEMMWQDGLGASPLQTDKDVGATDFSRIKSASVQMSLPAAESFAIKDAAEKIGRIFGKDLNRKDLIDYSSLSGRFENTKDIDVAVYNISNSKDRDEAMITFNSLSESLKNNIKIKEAISNF